MNKTPHANRQIAERNGVQLWAHLYYGVETSWCVRKPYTAGETFERKADAVNSFNTAVFNGRVTKWY